MSEKAFDPGSLDVQVSREGDAAVSVTLRLVRPDIAAFFRGRVADDVARRLPLLYSVCGKAQGLAARLALRAARGESVEPCRDPDVLAEARRERLMRLTLDWPRALGLPERRDLLVEGARPLARGDIAGWMSERLRPHVAALVAAGAPAATVQPVFAEELGLASARVLGPAAGRAEVVTARGTLAHEVELDGELVAAYRLIAPTDRHFAPDGPAAMALAALSAGTPEALRRAAELTVLGFDPCVPYAITVSA